MNLNQLQYFKILAQEEHYTRAAQMLSITQPSLSHAIAQLEEELGTRLFEKKGRNIVLTRYGKLFLPYVEESLKVLEEGVQRTRELNGSKEGIIHLAYIYTMGSNFTPKMVRNFLDAYPDYHIDFHFTVGTTGDILAGLKEDKYDMEYINIEKKKNGGIVTKPTYLYDALYSQFSIFDGFSIQWIDGEKKAVLEESSEPRINVPEYEMNNMHVPVPKKDVVNRNDLTKNGKYKQCLRKWKFKLKQ